MSALVHSLYDDRSIEQWQHERTMLHCSGIWGRQPTLDYLRDEIVASGQVVVDLGAGAGYPSLQLSTMVGPSGRVVGIELSEAMLDAARKHCRADNLSFERGDITQPLSLADAVADVVTGFMVLHNLRQAQMRAAFREVRRILKPSGRAVFLTMHPDAFESDWDLQFLSYDLSALRRYREATDKEDIEIPGRAVNVAGGVNSIITVFHSRRSVMEAADAAGLVLEGERDLWFDRETAVRMFGPHGIRKMPTTPIYWVLSFGWQGANGHDAAGLLPRPKSHATKTSDIRHLQDV